MRRNKEINYGLSGELGDRIYKLNLTLLKKAKGIKMEILVKVIGKFEEAEGEEVFDGWYTEDGYYIWEYGGAKSGVFVSIESAKILLGQDSRMSFFSRPEVNKCTEGLWVIVKIERNMIVEIVGDKVDMIERLLKG